MKKQIFIFTCANVASTLILVFIGVGIMTFAFCGGDILSHENRTEVEAAAVLEQMQKDTEKNNDSIYSVDISQYTSNREVADEVTAILQQQLKKEEEKKNNLSFRMYNPKTGKYENVMK